jgi:hypothetical protein
MQTSRIFATVVTFLTLCALLIVVSTTSMLAQIRTVSASASAGFTIRHVIHIPDTTLDEPGGSGQPAPVGESLTRDASNLSSEYPGESLGSQVRSPKSLIVLDEELNLGQLSDPEKLKINQNSRKKASGSRILVFVNN